MDITLSVTPDSVAVREAVTAELADLFAREAEPGGIIYRSHITEAVSVAAGEFDSTVTEPAANVSAPAGYLPELGTVTFTEAADGG